MLNVKIKRKDLSYLDGKTLWLPLRRDLTQFEKAIVSSLNDLSFVDYKLSTDKHLWAFLYRLSGKTVFSEPFLSPFLRMDYSNIVIWGLEEFQRAALLKRNGINYSVFFVIDPCRKKVWNDKEIEYLYYAEHIYVPFVNTSVFLEKTVLLNIDKFFNLLTFTE